MNTNISPSADTSAYLYDQLRAEATALLTATGLVEAAAVSLATPKPNIPADLAFPVFTAAKQAGAANPNEFAKQIASAITIPSGSLIGTVEAMGGFVNFAVEPKAFVTSAVSEVLTKGETFGSNAKIGAGQTVIVEYSSPNIAKKMHVGHLRTTVIGHSIYRILKVLGYHVIGDNHLGDWGTQFGYLLAAIHDGQLTPWNDADPIASLVKMYSEYYKASEADPSKKDAARAWFKRLEDGDSWARETWQRLIDLTMKEFAGTYERLGITFDTQHGESYFEPMLGPLVQEALEKGVATQEPGGAVVVDFGEKLPSCLLRKTDGGTLYQTRDVATCIYRWNEYKPTRNIYVVGAEQKLHFQQVFEITRRLGYPEIADCSVHIPFGMITKASGERFAARKGEAIFLEEVLDESISRARVKIREQIAAGKTDISGAALDAAAEVLGIGAVIYADLYQGPERNIQFDWDTMLSPDGNTATYIQYTHARCKSILRKAGDAATVIPSADLSLLTEPEAVLVVKQLHRLPHVVREAGEKFLPAVIADWTYNLGREFARFYDKHKVLDAPTPEQRAARLALVAAVGQGLKNGLYLLGIHAPEQM